MTFSLPPDVTVKKQIVQGQWVYGFRHNELGELGRVILQGLSSGHCNMACEVAGDSNDPMTEARLAVLQPISVQLAAALESAFGTVDQTIGPAPPTTPQGPSEVVESKLMPCDRCGETAAMLIFPTGVKTIAGFEDYARKMYAKYSDLNVPTWIIGDPLGDPGFDTCSQILKVWPQRGAILEMTPNDFNEELDKLLADHCN